MIDEKLLFILFIIVVSFLSCKKKRRRPTEEQQDESDAEWQREWEEAMRREEERRRAEARQRDVGDKEESAQQPKPKKPLLFEIPTIRKADPAAETRIPQHDRIFLEEKKEPEPFIQETPRRPRKEMRKETSIASAYRKKLNAPVVLPPEVHVPSAEAPQRRAWRPAKSALVQGVIMAEVLGAPKAYRNRNFYRR